MHNSKINIDDENRTGFTTVKQKQVLKANATKQTSKKISQKALFSHKKSNLPC